MHYFKNIYPVIKWPGGKRQLLSIINSMLPKKFNTYYEPFFGGGALFFYIQPCKSVINDCNEQLIAMYNNIKKDPYNVCLHLYEIQNYYNSLLSIKEKDSYYYKLRDKYNSCITYNIYNSLTAALFIFLNKAGYNGLYRVNSAGKYNVPTGHKNIINAYECENIIAMSIILNISKIMCGDFESCCKNAVAGDFIFFDSPYYDTFNSYVANGFSVSDHIRLYNLFDSLSKKGVLCMLTNNDCEFIKNMYSGYNIKCVNVNRMINCNVNNRIGKEVIITNYDINDK